MRNFKNIALHNVNYDAGLSTYLQNLNEYTDKEMSEVGAFSKTGNDSDEISFSKTNTNFTKFKFDPSMKIPDSFDWRDRNAVTSVKNQRDCGSCYAFGALGAVESNIYLKTGDTVDLSEQEIVDCAEGYGIGEKNLG
jgi:C1A family cysteine protease